MPELRQVAAYFVALLGLFAAGYAAAGLTTGPVYSLVSSISVPERLHLTAAESEDQAISPDSERLPVWIAPTPIYSYDPPSEAARARQSAQNESRRERRRHRPRATTSQSRTPAPRITIAPFQRPFDEPR